MQLYYYYFCIITNLCNDYLGMYGARIRGDVYE